MKAILFIQISTGDSFLQYTGNNWQIDKSWIMYAVILIINWNGQCARDLQIAVWVREMEAKCVSLTPNVWDLVALYDSYCGCYAPPYLRYPSSRDKAVKCS